MSLRVKHVMKAGVATVSPSDGLYVADRLMSLGDHRPLPVIKGTALVGILTQGDILRAAERLALGREFASTTAALRGLRVQEAMTKAVVTIGPDASVNEGIEQLLRHRVQCLPVMADGRLVGLFTESDLLRIIAPPTDGTDDRRFWNPTGEAHAASSVLRSGA